VGGAPHLRALGVRGRRLDVLRDQGCLAILVGLRIPPRDLLERAGLDERTDVVIVDDLGEAIEVAEARVPAHSRAG
jgi:hypothetical protein